MIGPMGNLRLTPALADAIITAVRQGIPAVTAAKAAGIHEGTFYAWLEAPIAGRWLRSGAEITEETLTFLTNFKERVEEAQAAFEQDMISNIVSAGFERNEKTGIRDWRAHAWIANNAPGLRERYRQERQTVISGEQIVHHEHTLARTLSDFELKKALGKPKGE